MQALNLLDSLINACSITNNIEHGVINIIHFNDVYNIDPVIEKDSKGNITSIKGGASRFKSFVNTLSPLKPLIIFSGDFLSPSYMSTATKGQHMISIMNDIGITCACLGNHELDYGNKHCIEMIAQLKFPVLNTNLLTPTNADDVNLDLEPLGQCIKSYVYKYNSHFNIGFVAISEDWTCTLPIAPEHGYAVLDFIQECRKSVNNLKKQTKIHLMVVLTHSRLANDKLLAAQINGVDLILGGHDHFYHCGMDENTKTLILKTGTDFHNISWLQLQINDNKATVHQCPITQRIEMELKESLNEKKGVFNGRKYKFINRHYNIDINIKPDAATEKLVHDLTHSFQEQLSKVIGHIAAPLDCSESVVRCKESTAGNFVADVIRRCYRCDAVIINGGNLRANRVIPSGPITTRDILRMVPFQDPILVLTLKGLTIIKILEHAVSALPKADGRFLQVSGIRFVFDDKAEIGQRVKKVWISKYSLYQTGVGTLDKSLTLTKYLKEEKKDSVVDEDCFALIDEAAIYKIATCEFLYGGGDGFEFIERELVEMIVDKEAGISMSVILRNFFWAIGAVNSLLALSDDKEKQKKKQSMMDRLGLSPSISGLRGSQSMLVLRSVSEPVTGGLYDELTISPCLEHRIMRVDEKIDLESMEFQGLKNFLSKVPSFTNMKHLPTQRSLIDILNDMEQPQTVQPETVSINPNFLQLPLTFNTTNLTLRDSQ